MILKRTLRPTYVYLFFKRLNRLQVDVSLDENEEEDEEEIRQGPDRHLAQIKEEDEDE